MKVIIAMSSSWGAYYIKGQGAYLKKNGCDVTFVSSPGKEIANLAQLEGANLIELPVEREISLWKDLISLIKIIRLIKKEKPDIINAGNPKTGFLYSIAHIFCPKIPVIFTLRGLRSDTLSGLKRKIVYLTEKMTCSLVNKVIVISPSLKDHAVEIGIAREEKCVVFGKGSSNGLDIQKYNLTIENKQKGIRIREKFNIKKSDILIGFVGRITKDKGIYELFEAYKIVSSRNKNVKLLLVGPIEFDDLVTEQFVNQLKSFEGVIMVGQTDDTISYYAAIDFLVLFSYREGFGNVVLEAAAMMRPAIVADIPGLRDTTEHLVSGIVVKPKDKFALTEAMDFYVNNREVLSRNGEQARGRVEKYFKNEMIWEGQLQLYKSMVKKSD